MSQIERMKSSRTKTIVCDGWDWNESIDAIIAIAFKLRVDNLEAIHQICSTI